MGRPKVPLISRRKVLEAALAIIDTEGLDALSIRRLAEELGVNGASLYHHFANKEAIVVGAAALALDSVRTPETSNKSWREWLPDNARMFRRALVAHPELVPVIVRLRAHGLGGEMLDTSAARLLEEGVPSGAVMPLLDALEFYAVGSALHEVHGDAAAGEVAALRAKPEFPTLTKVLEERGLTSDEVFDLVAASIVQAVDLAVKERQARWMPAGVPERGSQAAPGSQ